MSNIPTYNAPFVPESQGRYSHPTQGRGHGTTTKGYVDLNRNNQWEQNEPKGYLTTLHVPQESDVTVDGPILLDKPDNSKIIGYVQLPALKTGDKVVCGTAEGDRFRTILGKTSNTYWRVHRTQLSKFEGMLKVWDKLIGKDKPVLTLQEKLHLIDINWEQDSVLAKKYKDSIYAQKLREFSTYERERLADIVGFFSDVQGRKGIVLGINQYKLWSDYTIIDPYDSSGGEMKGGMSGTLCQAVDNNNQVLPQRRQGVYIRKTLLSSLAGTP